jgi:hypothetical protein
VGATIKAAGTGLVGDVLGEPVGRLGLEALVGLLNPSVPLSLSVEAVTVVQGRRLSGVLHDGSWRGGMGGMVRDAEGKVFPGHPGEIFQKPEGIPVG